MFKQQDCKRLVSNYTTMGTFHGLDVVSPKNLKLVKITHNCLISDQPYIDPTMVQCIVFGGKSNAT